MTGMHCRVGRILEFRTPQVAEWSAYWHGLPRDGLLPARSALDPADIKHLLPDMMVFDLSDPSVVRFRLAGTAIAARYGFDPTGRDFLQMLDAETREQSRQAMVAAVGHPFGILSRLRSRHGSGLQADIESLALPMSTGPGKAAHLITVSVRTEPNARLDLQRDSIHLVESVSSTFVDLGAGLPAGLPVR